MPDLRALLADGHVHVSDGAMGTLLYSKGIFLNVCYDELNLRQPDVIRDVHREYVRAGAELIETNTFGANPIKLAHHGLAAETEAINEAAARLAREAAGERAAVVGAIGPLGIRIEPFGETSVRGSPGGLRAAGGRAPGRRRGRLSPRDLQRRGGTPCRRGRGARPVRPPHHRPDDRRGGRPDPVRHGARRRSAPPSPPWAWTSSASTAASARTACSRPSNTWRGW